MIGPCATAPESQAKKGQTMEQAVERTRDLAERLARARCSLEGLSVGDAFGERFFLPPGMAIARIEGRVLPAAPWPYTDDTQMALSIVSILRQHGTINQDRLAESFAEQYDPSRGYGPAMHGLLRAIRAGRPWGEAARGQFEGQGSYGNGAAMRVAPLGAFFADDLDMVVEQAARSAEVTHTHPEGVAGAIAVAVAAGWAWRLGQGQQLPSRAEFLDRILPLVPSSEVRAKLRWARDALTSTTVESAVSMLGNGTGVSAQDTVPFALWCAGERLNNYEEALWLTVSGFGDRDTTCAMVGGIVSLYTGIDSIPSAWRQAREALPNWPFMD
jgi:ADP-ribosylglycohydrolase